LGWCHAQPPSCRVVSGCSVEISVEVRRRRGATARPSAPVRGRAHRSTQLQGRGHYERRQGHHLPGVPRDGRGGPRRVGGAHRLSGQAVPPWVPRAIVALSRPTRVRVERRRSSMPGPRPASEVDKPRRRLWTRRVVVSRRCDAARVAPATGAVLDCASADPPMAAAPLHNARSPTFQLTPHVADSSDGGCRR